MKIEPLADRPDFVPLLAEWHQREWNYLRPEVTLTDRVTRLAAFRRDELPMAYVAYSGEGLLGSALLVACDMEIRRELSPWLAGVYVAPEYRGRGIGTELTWRVARATLALGFRTLYLYTPSAATFYARLGWKVLETTDYLGVPVTLMSIELGTENHFQK